MSGTTALSQLRHDTASLHVSVERAFALGTRLASIAAYSDLLERLLRVHMPLETLVAPHAAALPALDYGARRRAALLAADLLALGRAPAAAVHPLPRLPVVSSPEHVLGVLYVVEGATLGGRIVAHAANRQLGLTRATGAAFFHGDGRRRLTRWREYLAVLERATGGRAAPAVTAAAVECFACFHTTLTT